MFFGGGKSDRMVRWNDMRTYVSRVIPSFTPNLQYVTTLNGTTTRTITSVSGVDSTRFYAHQAGGSFTNTSPLTAGFLSQTDNTTTPASTYLYSGYKGNTNVFYVNGNGLIGANGLKLISGGSSTDVWHTDGTYGAASSTGVTNVSSANTDISVSNPTTTPVLTLNSGAGANQIVKRGAGGSIGVGINDFTATGTPSSSTYLRGDNTWAAVVGGVSSFNTRTGSVVPVSGDYSALGETLTNKSISGSTNTITNVSLTTGVTGILPIANGGRGTSNPPVFNEVPSGTINGSNTTFTLANTPTAGTVLIYRNGLLQVPSVDYTISGSTITYLYAPSTGDVLRGQYSY